MLTTFEVIFLFLITYSLTSLILFATITTVSGCAFTDLSFFFLKKQLNLLSSLPKMMFTFAIFSLIGLPPFIGFFIKMLLVATLPNYSFFYMSLTLLYTLLLLTLFYLKHLNYLLSVNVLGRDNLLPLLPTPPSIRPTHSLWVFLITYLLIFLVLGFFFLNDLLILTRYTLL